MNPFLEMDMTNSTMGKSQGQLFINRDVRLLKIQKSFSYGFVPFVAFVPRCQKSEILS